MQAGSEFQEGDIFEFRNVSIGTTVTLEAGLTLHAGRNCSFRKLSNWRDLPPNQTTHFIPRSPVTNFASLQTGTLFDCDVFVVSVCKSGLVCIDVGTTTIDATTPLLVISGDVFETLTSVRCNQIWSLRDLRFRDFDQRHRCAAANVTEKTSCISPPNLQTKLELLKSLCSIKRDLIDKRMKSFFV